MAERQFLISESRKKVTYWLNHQYSLNPFPLDGISQENSLEKKRFNTQDDNWTKLKMKSGTKLKIKQNYSNNGILSKNSTQKNNIQVKKCVFVSNNYFSD